MRGNGSPYGLRVGAFLLVVGLPMLGIALTYQRLYHVLNVSDAVTWQTTCRWLWACSDSAFIVLPRGVTTYLLYGYLIKTHEGNIQ